MCELSGTRGRKEGEGLGETSIESLRQACAKVIFFNPHIASCKMENLPLPVLIRKLRVGSNTLDIKQLQTPELGFASTRMGATNLARGLSSMNMC